MTLEQLQEGKIFLIDKPLDWTSFDVVNKIKWNIRHHFKIKKIKVGHAGTLDPKATGLLIVCVGKATKQIPNIQDQTKVYTGTLKLGAQTPSYDTETTEEKLVSLEGFDLADLQQLSSYFKDEFSQTPPIFSAIKKDGKRAYEFAREGKPIELKARNIYFYDFQIEKVALPFVEFRVECSKGTYIRSLAHDAGEKLGTGAYLYALRREKIGDYSVMNANNDILFDKKYFSLSF